MPSPGELFAEAYAEFERRLDEVERVGEELVDEALQALPQQVAEREKERKRRAFRAYAAMVTWSYRKQARFLGILSRLYTQPPLASIIGARTVTFIRRGPGGQVTPVTVRYTAFDAIDFMTAYTLASTREGRERVYRAVLAAFESSKFRLDGELVGFEEYLRRLGVSREKFEEALREYLDEAMDSYLKEIEETRGSRLAKHIWLRDRAKADPETPHFWLLVVSQSVALSLVNLHAASVILKKLKPEDRESKAVLRAARDLYREFNRFERRITRMEQALVSTARRVGLGEASDYKPTLDEALRRIRETQEAILEHPATGIATAGILGRVFEVLSPHVIGVSPSRELGARARAKHKRIEQEEVRLDELLNTRD